MQNHIDEALKEFESVFSRHSSWLLCPTSTILAGLASITLAGFC